MAMRYFNWKLALVLLIGFAVLVSTAVGLRQWQKSRGAEHALEAGLAAYGQQNWQEAASNLGRYIAVNGENVDALQKYADSQLKIRPSVPANVWQAIETYRTILRLDESNTEAAKKLTEIYLAIGYPGEAELIARRQLEIEENPELRRMFGLALARQGKFTEAADELRNVLAKNPDNILTYELLGRLTEQRPQDFSQPAISWLNLAVENNPSSALAYIIRGNFNSRNGDKVKALADLEQAEKLDVSDPNVQLRLVTEFMSIDILDKAEKHIAAVKSVEPANQALWQIWAQMALRSALPEKMQEVAETGLKELSAQPWDFLPTAAELFIRAGELDRASECISKLREKNLHPEMLAFFDGLIAERKDRLYDAIKSWRRSIELGNESPQIRLGLASAMSRLGDTQSALRELRSLVSEKPDFFEGRMALVRLLAQMGNWAETSEQALQATQMIPNNFEANLYYLRARIYLLAEQPESGNAQDRQNIEKRLAELEKIADVSSDVKALQFQVAMQKKDFSQAESILTELKKDGLVEPRIVLAETELLMAQGKTSEATSVLTRAIEQYPEADELVRNLAVLLYRQDDRKQCEEVINAALNRIESAVAQRELVLLLAQLYTSWQEKDKAYELLKTYSEKLPNDIPIKRRLLTCEQVTNNALQAQQLIDAIKTLEGDNGWQWRYEQAKAWFSGADFKKYYPQITTLLRENLLANPNDQISHTLLAAVYDRAGDTRLAISTYREALSRSPDDLRIIIPCVASMYRARQYDQADEILNKASQRKLYHPQLQALQLQSYLRHGELTSASALLEDLLSNDPNNRSACLSLALIKMQQKQFTEAGQLLNQLRAGDPNSLDIAFAQVQLNLRQNQSQQAIQICNELVDRLGNSSVYILRARTLATLGQTKDAQKDLEHATSIEPDNIEVWTASCDFHRSLGQMDRAISDIQQALSVEPNNIESVKRAVPLLLASGKPDTIQQGKTLLDNALKSNPLDIDLQLLKARSLLAEGTASSITDAEKILQKIADSNPQVIDAWLLLGEISLRNGEPSRAADAAMRGLPYQPDNKALLLLKARAEAQRAPILAIPTLRSLRELDPNDVNIALFLARTYIAADQAEKAADLLNDQKIPVTDISGRRNVDITLATALYKSGRTKDAQEKFDALYKSAPDDPAPLFAETQLLRESQLWNQLRDKVNQWFQNHPDDVNTPITIAVRLNAVEDEQAQKISEELLNNVLKHSPTNLAAMNTLAMLLHKNGRYPETIQLYQQILKLTPDNVIAMNNLAWILCEEQGQYQQALELAQRGLALAPQYIDLIDTRGMIYLRLGDFEKAIQDFTKSLDLYPKTSRTAVATRFHLATALSKTAQKAKAIDQLKQALSLNSQIGGLSSANLVEAQHLLEQLEKGG